MRVYRLEKRDHINTRPLYEEVFSEDSKAFVDYYYSEKIKYNQIYAVAEEEEIHAMLHLNPYRMCVNGQEQQANYIVAVATGEPYRRRGYMGALIRRALKDMYQNKEAFTFLMPAAEGIYLPYDFRTVYEQERRLHLPTEDTAGLMVKGLEGSECQQLAEFVNEQLFANYQVFARRDAAYYRRLIKECAADGGRIMVYWQGGRIADCRLWLPEEEDEKPKIMTRIVRLERMMTTIQLTGPLSICFKVTDPLIKENNRCITLSGTEESKIQVAEGGVHNSQGIITIAALTSLVFGAASIEDICKEEGVVMTERMKTELRKLVPLSRIYLNELV